MADLRWIKITTDIFDDEKLLLIESMPEHESIIVIWFKLLCPAGKQNNSGVFTFGGQMAYTDEMFATIFRRPLSIIRIAFRTFEQFGMIEVRAIAMYAMRRLEWVAPWPNTSMRKPRLAIMGRTVSASAKMILR